MRHEDATVFVVDDDHRVREALSSLLRSLGFRVITFGSALEFLASKKQNTAGCLILDLDLPDISGLQLQQELTGNDALPIIFISGHGDIPASVKAMKGGAIEFLPKPFSELDLLAAVETGIILDQRTRQKRVELTRLQARYGLLTPREREVVAIVVSGSLNKQAAYDLGISETTIGVHRSNAMRKMEAQSLAELVRMADTLGITKVEPKE